MLPNGKSFETTVPANVDPGGTFVHRQYPKYVRPDHFSDGVLALASKLQRDLQSCGGNARYDVTILVDNTTGMYRKETVSKHARANKLKEYEGALIADALVVPMNAISDEMVHWFPSATTFFNKFKLLSALVYMALHDRKLEVLEPHKRTTAPSRRAWRRLDSYDNVWSIESDVRLTGNWCGLLNQHARSTAGYVAYIDYPQGECAPSHLPYAPTHTNTHTCYVIRACYRKK